MPGFQSCRSLQFLFFLFPLFLHSFSVLASDPSSPKETSKNTNSNDHKGSSMVLKIIIICIGVASVIAFSVFLFKVWQKKKREEQHARLLKLFEDDDELELELGLRD